MAAATVNMPAIVLSGGPMLKRMATKASAAVSGTVGPGKGAPSSWPGAKIDYEEFMNIVASSAPSVGHCNTMGTALRP